MTEQVDRDRAAAEFLGLGPPRGLSTGARHIPETSRQKGRRPRAMAMARATGPYAPAFLQEAWQSFSKLWHGANRALPVVAISIPLPPR
ncbi:hypothetical protein ABZ079_15620 [Streptomyces sp. NPDC006314]|uniref:hypothetical protein n=1 Tax=Streptomyces sp. NPDC006314 TaxID=3154475 RepID=UPI0033BA43E3